MSLRRPGRGAGSTCESRGASWRSARSRAPGPPCAPPGSWPGARWRWWNTRRTRARSRTNDGCGITLDPAGPDLRMVASPSRSEDPRRCRENGNSARYGQEHPMTTDHTIDTIDTVPEADFAEQSIPAYPGDEELEPE